MSVCLVYVRSGASRFGKRRYCTSSCCRDVILVAIRGVVVPEILPFRQIFLSRNGAPVNIVYHSRNAARQISSYYKSYLIHELDQLLVLRKIIDNVATRCHILRLKCTKFDFRWGSALQTPTGELTELPRPLAGFKGAYF